jgi:hypothetical protein
MTERVALRQKSGVVAVLILLLVCWIVAVVILPAVDLPATVFKGTAVSPALIAVAGILSLNFDLLFVGINFPPAMLARTPAPVQAQNTVLLC